MLCLVLEKRLSVFLSFVYDEKYGTLLFEYHTPSWKPSSSFREETLVMNPISGTWVMLGSVAACGTVDSCPTHPWGPVLLSEAVMGTETTLEKKQLFPEVHQERLSKMWLTEPA